MVDPEKYLNTSVFVNLRNITNHKALEKAESVVSALRLTEFYNNPSIINSSIDNNFNLISHLKAIHKHLFQDIYLWAGEVRSYPMKIGIDVFTPPDDIEYWANEITIEIKEDHYLIAQEREFIVKKVARYLGIIGILHPFPEGNGRTQRALLWQLTLNAGYTLRWEKVHPWESMVTAQNIHRNKDYSGMEIMVDRILTSIEPVALYLTSQITWRRKRGLIVLKLSETKCTIKPRFRRSPLICFVSCMFPGCQKDSYMLIYASIPKFLH